MPFNWKNGDNSWNGISPTVAMLSRFYTKNGLPMDEDKTLDYSRPWSLVTVDSAHMDEACLGRQTMRFDLDREPRFYSWIAFQNGFYEILSASNDGAYTDDANYKNFSDGSHGKLVTSFVVGGNCSRGKNANNLRSNNYAPSGFLNKKFVDPDIAKKASGLSDYRRALLGLCRVLRGDGRPAHGARIHRQGSRTRRHSVGGSGLGQLL